MGGQLAQFQPAAWELLPLEGWVQGPGKDSPLFLSPFQRHQSKNHTGLPLVTEEAGLRWTGAEPGQGGGGYPYQAGGWEGWSLPWEAHAWIGRT